MAEEKMQVFLITGLSGAGKTHAADWFEDQGFYCVDNLPPRLIRSFLELAMQGGSIHRAAFVVDIRSESFFPSMEGTLERLREAENVDFKILFIEASDSTIVKRYNETRRQHPLTKGPASIEVIERERGMLRKLRQSADYVIDTTDMKVARFQAEMDRLFNTKESDQFPLTVNIQSFGYKYGLPPEADMTLDMRFLPNPFYVASLKHLTGKNQKVRHYVLKTEAAQTFLKQLAEMITYIAPLYVKEGKYHLNLAFGCTGGQHRSVVMAEESARIFREMGFRVSLNHRQLR